MLHQKDEELKALNRSLSSSANATKYNPTEDAKEEIAAQNREIIALTSQLQGRQSYTMRAFLIRNHRCDIQA